MSADREQLRDKAAKVVGIRPGAAPSWKDELAGKGDSFLGDERNILIALRRSPELTGLVRLNEFSLEVELIRDPPWRARADRLTWDETDDTQLMAWLQTQELRVRNRGAVADSVAVVAYDYRFHPVRDYLNSLAWDGMPRLQTFLAYYFGAEGDEVYLHAAGSKFMVSAVARILKPGCQADHTLVLEGPQGIGKTSAARILAREPKWFAGSLPDLGNKDAMLQLVGRWIIEIAELKAIRTSQVEATKSFLTQTHDTFRPPYGRRTAQFPRQCVFIATTNESEYLRDRTGNRRYWPVKCSNIDLDALAHDRDQLWAQAVAEFRAGALWHLTSEEGALAAVEQHDRVHVTELEHAVREYLVSLTTSEVTTQEVLRHALHLDSDKPDYHRQAKELGPQVADALRQCGWVREGRRGRAKRTTYVRPGGQG